MHIYLVEAQAGPGQTSHAAHWLRWRGAQLGLQFVDEPTDADVVFVTCASVRSAPKVRQALKLGPPVVIGGGGCWEPAWAPQDVAGVCVGEGLGFLRALAGGGLDEALRLPNVWVPGEDRAVIPSTEFDWEMPPSKEHGDIVRVVSSRGCPQKCLFCATGWSRKFVAHPDQRALRRTVQALGPRGMKLDVRLITNDLGADEWALLPRQKVASLRASWALKLLRTGHDMSKYITTARIGVEGTSERLRLAVKKPISHDDLIELCVRLTAQHVQVKCFMIAGLPGETQADWDEFEEVNAAIKRHAHRCVYWSFTAFTPEPCTPLGCLPISDEYDGLYERYRSRSLEPGRFSKRNGVLCRPAKPPGRMKDAVLKAGATEAEVRRGWMHHDNPNWRVQYYATPERLRALARHYAERIGVML